MTKRGRWMSCPKNKADYKSEEEPEDEEQKMVVPTSEVIKNANGYKEGHKIGSVDWVDRLEDIPPDREPVYQVTDGLNSLEIMKQEIRALQERLDESEAKQIADGMVLSVSQFEREMEDASIRWKLPDRKDLLDSYPWATRIWTALSKLSDQILRREVEEDETVKAMLAIANDRKFKDFYASRNRLAHPTGVSVADIEKMIADLKDKKMSAETKKKYQDSIFWLEKLKKVPNFDRLLEKYNERVAELG